MEKCNFQNFRSPVTLTLDRVTQHTIVHQSSTLSTHQISLKSEKVFVDGRMDVRTGRIDGRTYLLVDRWTFPILMLLRRLGGVDLIMSVTIFPLVI